MDKQEKRRVRGSVKYWVFRDGTIGVKDKALGETVAMSTYRDGRRINLMGVSWNADLVRMLAWGKVSVTFKDGDEDNHSVDNLIVKLEV